MAVPVAQPRADQALQHLAELEPTCRRGVLLVAIRALGREEEARDVAQEVMARAVVAIREGRVPTGVALPTFVHGIARHVIADVIRARMRRRAEPLPEDAGIPGPGASPLDAIVATEERARLADALQGLPQEDRNLLHRAYVEGEPLEAIAASLGVPGERIRKRKSRVLQRLRAIMGTGHDSRPRATERA